MTKLRTPWLRSSEEIGLFGIEDKKGLHGVLRILKFPFYERKEWGYSDESRGEIQDVYIDEPERYLEVSIEEAKKVIIRHGLKAYSISEWKAEYLSIIEHMGHYPFARTVIIGWNLEEKLRKEPNKEIDIKVATRELLPLLKEIQIGSWGFFIPPNFNRQKVFVAFLNGIPVGSMYLNPSSGNIDFGIHVKREYQRRHIGTTLLNYAKEFFKKKGRKYMWVTRVLRALYKMNESDRIAISFYINTGGFLARDIRSMRKTKRKPKNKLPEFEEYIL